jgi:branched-chain amino acid aminotransferase
MQTQHSFCGTAAEVIGWESFNDIKFKKNWKETVSRKIQQAYSARVTEAE